MFPHTHTITYNPRTDEGRRETVLGGKNKRKYSRKENQVDKFPGGESGRTPGV
jgi:hypothetical protein